MESAPPQPVDRISNMPEPIIDDILIRMTTLEAAKTSILSKQWRYKWAKLPHLIFDYAVCEPFLHWKLEESRTTRFLLFLDQLLLHHEGPTIKLNFVVPKLQSYSRIDDLIDLLSDQGVEEFTLELNDVYTLPCSLFTLELNDAYKLPSSLFLYSQLKYLKLVGGWIRPPPLTFKGFHGLVRLELVDVRIDDEVIESLVSSCQKLEHLLLAGATEFERLEIVAPALKFFDFRCDCAIICFKRTPRLETVKVMVYDPDIVAKLLEYGNINFAEFFDSLPALRKLSLDFYFITVLTAGQVQARLPTLLVHLRTLKLYDMYFDEVDHLSCVISLISSSPNLEELKITGYSFGTRDAPALEFLDVQVYSNVMLNQLQKVKLLGIGGKVPEIALIKLLLEKSSKLESMVIHYEGRIHRHNIEGCKVVEEVNNFKAVSPHAKVIHKFV